MGKSLGVPLFQEQAMRLAIVAAGFTAEEADQLRRAMATFKLTGGVARYRERLAAGMVRRGHEQDFAEQVFQQNEGFGSYGFPESHAASFAHLVYASAWVKCHYPAVFACALLNSQPMGFYAPAQIVCDAREHGVVILAIDVNASDWDSSLEAEPVSTGGLALRLRLRLVAGLQEEAARAILAARQARNGAPFASVEEAAWQAGVQALGALADADALAGTGTSRRKAAWDAHAVASGPETLPLFAAAPETAAAAMAAQTPLLPEPEVALPHQGEGEEVATDCRATGLTLGRHPLALLRPVLDRLSYADIRWLDRLRSGASIRLPGLVLMRQRPGSAQGVVFMTVEDEHGIGNLVIYTDVAARDRAALVAGRLLIAEGRVERQVEHAGVPIIHLVVRRLIDRSDLLACLTDPGVTAGKDDWVDRVLGRADEVQRPEPGSQRAGPKLPGSRDFR